LSRVVFAESAKADLDAIFTWIADHASEDIAGSYVARIRRFCEEIPPFPLRGTKRDDLNITPSFRGAAQCSGLPRNDR
jgi:plasmid stabilization system protein ParE